MCASVYSSLLLFTLTTISVSKRAPSACKHSRNARLTFTCNNNCSKEKCNSERKYQILPPRSIPRCLTFVLHGFSHITRYFPNGKRIFFKKKSLQIFSIFINFSNTTVNSEPVRFPAWLKWNRSSVKSRLNLVAEFFQKNSYI
jgi:hypothetical protein